MLVTVVSAARTAFCADCVFVVDVLLDVFCIEPEELLPDVPGKLKKSEVLEEDELEELEFDDEPENNESSVCVTTCSAARTSCAA